MTTDGANSVTLAHIAAGLEARMDDGRLPQSESAPGAGPIVVAKVHMQSVDLFPLRDMPLGEFRRRVWRWANTFDPSVRTLLGVIGERIDMSTGIANAGGWSKIRAAWKARLIEPSRDGRPVALPSHATVKRWLRTLEEHGIVDREQMQGGYTRYGAFSPTALGVNEWRLNLLIAFRQGRVEPHDFLAPFDEASKMSRAMSHGTSPGMSPETSRNSSKDSSRESGRDSLNKHVKDAPGRAEDDWIVCRPQPPATINAATLVDYVAALMAQQARQFGKKTRHLNRGMLGRNLKVLLQERDAQDVLGMVDIYFGHWSRSQHSGIANPAAAFQYGIPALEVELRSRRSAAEMEANRHNDDFWHLHSAPRSELDSARWSD
jgi:DNA-binding PadR family transcriptional regulator